MHSRKSDPKHPPKGSKPSTSGTSSGASTVARVDTPAEATAPARVPKTTPVADIPSTSRSHTSPPRSHPSPTPSHPKPSTHSQPSPSHPKPSTHSQPSPFHPKPAPRSKPAPSQSKPFISVWGSPPQPSRLLSEVVSKRKSSPSPPTTPTHTSKMTPLKSPSPIRKLARKAETAMTVDSPSLTQVLNSQSPTPSTTNDTDDMWEDSQAANDESLPDCFTQTKGPLSPRQLVDFLAAVKMRKKPTEVAKKFTNSVPGLVKQLKPLRNSPLLNKGMQQRISKLIKSLDK